MPEFVPIEKLLCDHGIAVSRAEARRALAAGRVRREDGRCAMVGDQIPETETIRVRLARVLCLTVHPKV